MQISKQAIPMAFFGFFIALLPLAASHVTLHSRDPTDTAVAAAVRESADIAWKAAGQAGLARAGTSKLRSQISKLGAEKKKEEAEQMVKVTLSQPQAAESEAAAQASLNQALAYEDQVKKMLKTVEEESFKNAKIAANKEVAKLEKESKKYYQSLLAKFKASALPGPPTAGQAAAQAAKPYMDVQLRVGALVKYYNEKATASIAQAQQSATQAKAIAVTAQQEQAAGNVEMAQRHMMQAHMMVGAANLKQQEAIKIRKLAENFNMQIPSYQAAAQQAASHALATFAGLQRHKVLDQSTLRFFEQASAVVTSTISQASKLLDTMAQEMQFSFE